MRVANAYQETDDSTFVNPDKVTIHSSKIDSNTKSRMARGASLFSGQWKSVSIMRFPLVFELIAILVDDRRNCASLLLKSLLAVSERKLSFITEVDGALEETRMVDLCLSRTVTNSSGSYVVLKISNC